MDKGLFLRIMWQAACNSLCNSKELLAYWTVNKTCFADRALAYFYRMAKRDDWKRIVAQTCSKRCVVEFYKDSDWEPSMWFNKLTPLCTSLSHFVLTPSAAVYFSTTMSDTYTHAHEFRTTSYMILHLKANALSTGILVYCLKVDPKTTDFSTINTDLVKQLRISENCDKNSSMHALQILGLI
jgi:hypothetical protein